jgi:phosphoethanolamine N-methyltransferase
MSEPSPPRRDPYDERNIASMELVYGEGFLSPGGAAEVERIVCGLDLAGCDLLDVGCGLGGALIALAKGHATRRAVGIDVSPAVLERAARLVDAAALGGRIELRQVEPGPLPFPDRTFDVVYVNSVSCHMRDLADFFGEVFRVLRIGGHLLGAEWIRGDDRVSFEAWDDLLRGRGLDFYFVPKDEFARAIERGGFPRPALRDRTDAMRTLSEEGLARVHGSLRSELVETIGAEGFAAFVHWGNLRIAALRDGGIEHAHFRARKPGPP